MSVVDHNLIGVTHTNPDFVAPGRELHVQDGGAGFEFVHDFFGNAVDHLDCVVQGVGKVDPDLTAIRARNGENRLAMYVDRSDWLERDAVQPDPRLGLCAAHARREAQRVHLAVQGPGAGGGRFQLSQRESGESGHGRWGGGRGGRGVRI